MLFPGMDNQYCCLSVLGVVADLILPDGNIKKIYPVFNRVIMLTVLIKPVLHIFNHMTDLNNLAARNMVLMDLSSLNYKIELYDDKQRKRSGTISKKPGTSYGRTNKESDWL